MAAAALCLVVLTGCSSSQALTVGEAEKPTASPIAVVDAAKEPLTKAQAKYVLPSAAQLGKKWKKGKSEFLGESSDSGDSEGTFSPKKCNLSEAIGENDVSTELSKLDAAVDVERDYTRKGGSTFDNTGARVNVRSYEKDVSSVDLESFRDKLAECKEFSYTDENGITSDIKILPLSLPKYGDKTLAFRLQGQVSFLVIIADFVQVVSGHNVVTVTQYGLGKIDTKLAANATEAAMANLDEATKKQ